MQLDGESPDPHLNRGTAEEALGQWAAAEADYRWILERAPSDEGEPRASALYNLGNVQGSLGDWQEARRCFEAASLARPGFAMARSSSALAAFQLGDRAEAERLAGITREIIELSRLQADGAMTEFQPVELNAVVAQAVDQHRIFAASKGIEIVAGNNGSVRVLADEARLVLAISNLVSNAVQYSPDGSRVGVGVTHTDGEVEISVTDQGIGMTKEESERVFERFYRTDQARSRTTGGTGLGLSIVKHIVANHGGDIRVWTQPGSGSTFTIRLPEVRMSEAEDSGEEKSVA
jgi:signal transduction histidine kinase